MPNVIESDVTSQKIESDALALADCIRRREFLADYPEEITSEITAEMLDAGCRILSPDRPDWPMCERVAEVYAEMRVLSSAENDRGKYERS